MKRNGFTVVEILTTFVLITIVVSLLLIISTSLGKIYTSTSVKTELYYTQSVISNELNKVFLGHNVSSVTKCGDKCLLVSYHDAESKKIEIDETLVHIDGMAYDIPQNSEMGEVKFDVIYSPITHKFKPDTILNIKIPITYRNIDGDFGVNIVYQFNRSSVTVSL